MHFHKWSKWQDVKISDEPKFVPPGFTFVRETIAQQKRCSVCNLVKTRRA